MRDYNINCRLNAKRLLDVAV